MAMTDRADAVARTAIAILQTHGTMSDAEYLAQSLRALAEEVTQCTCGAPAYSQRCEAHIREVIAAALIEAQRMEREMNMAAICARCANDSHGPGRHEVENCGAAAIRARGEKG